MSTNRAAQNIIMVYIAKFVTTSCCDSMVNFRNTFQQSTSRHYIWVKAQSMPQGASSVQVCRPAPCKSTSEKLRPRMYGSSGICTCKLARLSKCLPCLLPFSETESSDNTAHSWQHCSSKGTLCFNSVANFMPYAMALANG